MATIRQPLSNTFKCLLQAENSMTGRAYMGEVLVQVWLKSIELLDKQVNAQKDILKNTSGVHTNSRKPTKKCAMKIKVE